MAQAPENASKLFSDVLDAELRSFTDKPGRDQGQRSEEEIISAAHDARLAGLAFSGGGIRSATFNLGVLQALADLRLLRKFHYLSTVSGGGYIGSWLIAWIHRRDRNLEGVTTALRTAWEEHPGGDAPEEIRFLRRFSNYLTPKLGWLGADTWTVIAIYLRNVALNLTAVMAGFAVVLMSPRFLGWALSYLPSKGVGFLLLLLIFFALLVVAGCFAHFSLKFFQVDQQEMWTADPVSLGEPLDPNVLRADAAVASPKAGIFQPWFKSEFDNFVLGFEFVMNSSRSEADVCLRIDPSSEPDENAANGFVIHLGGETRSKVAATCTTGGIVGRQKAKGARLAPPGEPNEVQILCRDQTCTVRLNGRIVNTFRAHKSIAAQGRIGARIDSAEAAVEFREIRLRKLAPPASRLLRQEWVQLCVVAPLFLAALLTVRILPLTFAPGAVPWLPATLKNAPWMWWGLIAGAVAFVVHLTGLFGEKSEAGKFWHRMVPSVLAITAGGMIGGLVLEWFHRLLPVTLGQKYFWPRLVWMPPGFIIAVSIMLIVYVGLLGRDQNEPMREWWSRLGAWLLIYTLLWLGLFLIAFYSPPVLRWMTANLQTTLAALGFGWIFTTASSLVAATSPATGRRGKNKWLEMLVAVGPYVFILGLFACLAWGIDRGLRPPGFELDPSASRPVEVGVSVKAPEMTPISVAVTGERRAKPGLGDELLKHWQALNAAHFSGGAPISPQTWLLFGLMVGGAVTVGFLSWRVDINDFSMHTMYRNRLARCYLGASNTGLRHPHSFTGFDPNDDIYLEKLDQPTWNKEITGPYPVINCALNLVGGGELAWQERKAASFVFTPKYCGYDFSDLPPGYRRTGAASDKDRGYASSRAPLTLATAMAISGAAASPNMGYHTSPAPAFLMTLFNVRLGWWIGNPRADKGWMDSSPNVALPWLLAEMLGLTHARGRYVYLSDGGHFENLGILELVRRRCRFIVACDAEDDHDFEFGGLGNAIEKCRTDLGIDIELDVEAIRNRNDEGQSRAHCAVGRIRYDQCDPGAPVGTLLYIKSSLTGDEPTDVLRYAARSPSFPHETTNDQWFGESQFESYRALGHHATLRAFEAVDAPENLSSLTTERLFVELAQRWYPPCRPLDPSFRRRGETLKAIYETLRTDADLRFLTQQIFPEWRALMANLKPPPAIPYPNPWLPQTENEVRAGLHFCNRLIQLMEDVYHDLHLEQEHSHPDNRGWINLFKHWAWARTFRITWTVAAANSGARFQNFCQRILGLEVGNVKIVRATRRNPADPNFGTELSLQDLTETKDPADASILTPVEKQLLDSLRGKYIDFDKTASLRLIQIAPGGLPGEEGPPFVVGMILLRYPTSEKEAPTILYFRVRDHLRRMGLARRALYALLDENMRQHSGLDTFPSIELGLWSLPSNSPEPSDDAAEALLRNLHRGVELELEGVFDNTVKISCFVTASEDALRESWLKAEKREEWLVEKKQGRSKDSEMFACLRKVDKAEGGRIVGEWISGEVQASPVTVWFEDADQKKKVNLQIRFLPTRTARDETRRKWLFALDRLRTRLEQPAAT